MAEIKYTRFAGIYNLNESPNLDTLKAVLGKGAVYLSEAKDVDIDDSFKPKQRAGRNLKLSGNYRSIWSNNKTVLAIKSGNLVRIADDYSETPLKAGLGDFDMVYADTGEKIYLTNNVYIGYFKNGTVYDLSLPAYNYKKTMPPGHLIEHYRGRLCIARNNLIIFSDGLDYDHYDERQDKSFIQLQDKITMMKAVSDGLWVSDGRITAFLSGTSPLKMVKTDFSGYGSIENTARSEKELIINGEFYDNAVLWSSKNGICVGGSGGRFKNLTEDRFLFTPDMEGIGFIRRGGVDQYIVLT